MNTHRKFKYINKSHLKLTPNSEIRPLLNSTVLIDGNLFRYSTKLSDLQRIPNSYFDESDFLVNQAKRRHSIQIVVNHSEGFLVINGCPYKALPFPEFPELCQIIDQYAIISDKNRTVVIDSYNMSHETVPFLLKKENIFTYDDDLYFYTNSNFWLFSRGNFEHLNTINCSERLISLQFINISTLLALGEDYNLHILSLNGIKDPDFAVAFDLLVDSKLNAKLASPIFELESAKTLLHEMSLIYPIFPENDYLQQIYSISKDLVFLYSDLLLNLAAHFLRSDSPVDTLLGPIFELAFIFACHFLGFPFLYNFTISTKNNQLTRPDLITIINGVIFVFELKAGDTNYIWEEYYSHSKQIHSSSRFISFHYLSLFALAESPPGVESLDLIYERTHKKDFNEIFDWADRRSNCEPRSRDYYLLMGLKSRKDLFLGTLMNNILASPKFLGSKMKNLKKNFIFAERADIFEEFSENFGKIALILKKNEKFKIYFLKIFIDEKDFKEIEKEDFALMMVKFNSDVDQEKLEGAIKRRKERLNGKFLFIDFQGFCHYKIVLLLHI